MAITRAVRSVALWTAVILAAVVLWCVMMIAAVLVYAAAQGAEVPVSSTSRYFGAETWDDGYFTAQGSLKNNSAKSDDEEIVLQTTKVSCQKSANSCTVSTASVYDGYLNLEQDNYTTDVWDDRLISFKDDSAACVTQLWTIDRLAKTLTLSVRKRAVIPDWAAKSSLRPCEGSSDKDVTLVDGFQVYMQKRQAFDRAHGFAFHTSLIVLNVVFFGLLIWLWLRRKRRLASASDASK